jgi:FkbH-like protein
MVSSSVKELLRQNDTRFWAELAAATREAGTFDELMLLSALRKKATARSLPQPAGSRVSLRLAILGGCCLYPLHELLTHLLELEGVRCELFLGDYDNYVAEIMEREGPLYRFSPQAILLLPGTQRCKHPGGLAAQRAAVQQSAEAVAKQLIDLCRTLNDRTGAEIVLGNFMLPARHDPGSFRSRTMASDWNFRKWVNLELGLNSPACVQICDVEFLANRHGALAAEDPRGWFESKQPCSASLLVEVSREAARLLVSLRRPPKKVLVLDLDNTLWGGVVAEDGLDGIVLGDTSPRGEAYKDFQRYVLSLKERGVLLAVCSKNTLAQALEPLEKHPEMILRAGDFVSFKANWEPKSDNLRQMAAELGLGLDSFVFVDDNPAEIEIVRQFAPEVTTILLSPDPAEYTSQLRDCRWFEPRSMTAEDVQRTDQYRAEDQRKSLLASTTDMEAYLESLRMEAVISEFTPLDVPRLAQLINKSNQFNLTTRRRTEGEVAGLIGRNDYVTFSIRLQDRFGDHGLIAVVIGQPLGGQMVLDTWLMSCRVLKRQVEELTLNEIARLAASRGCVRLQGIYLPTPKNDMVRDLYPRLGFQPGSITPDQAEFVLDLRPFVPRQTHISVRHHAYEPK